MTETMLREQFGKPMALSATRINIGDFVIDSDRANANLAKTGFDTEDNIKHAVFAILGSQKDARGAMPVDWLPDLVRPETPYLLAVKDDGLRAWLICFRGVVVLMISWGKEPNAKGYYETRYHYLQVTSVYLREACYDWDRITVLDGEFLMSNKTEHDTYSVTFIASSCLILDGHSVSYETCLRRWKTAQAVVERLNKKAGSKEEYFFVRCKIRYHVDQFIKDVAPMIARGVYEWGKGAVSAIDGIMIYAADAKLQDDGSLMKIKPNPTVDFRIKRTERPKKARGDAEWGLYVVRHPDDGEEPAGKKRSSSGTERQPETLVASFSIDTKLPDGSELEDHHIYECEYVSARIKWRPVRLRADKKTPNFIATYNDALSHMGSDYLRNNFAEFFAFMKAQYDKQVLFRLFGGVVATTRRVDESSRVQRDLEAQALPDVSSGEDQTIAAPPTRGAQNSLSQLMALVQGFSKR